MFKLHGERIIHLEIHILHVRETPARKGEEDKTFENISRRERFLLEQLRFSFSTEIAPIVSGSVEYSKNIHDGYKVADVVSSSSFNALRKSHDKEPARRMT